MNGWTVTLRGIGFRLGRSLLVLAIAMVATAAAVATLAYERAAEQSVLADALRSASTSQTDMVVTVHGADSLTASRLAALADVQSALAEDMASTPLLRRVTAPAITAEDTGVLVRAGDGGGLASLGYRTGVCAYMQVSGRCPSADGEVMVSRRTADHAGIHLGDKITMQYGLSGVIYAAPGKGSPRTITVPPLVPGVQSVFTSQVVGLYTPLNPQADYWYGDLYFLYGDDPASPTRFRYDTVFTGSDADIRRDRSASMDVHIEIPLRPDSVHADDVAAVRSELATLTNKLGASGLDLASGLAIVFDQAAVQQHGLATTIPVAAVPLILLALFVLFLVVGALTDERAPELAIAKLRGYSAAAANRFGAAEMLLLILLAGPLGLFIGITGVQVAAHLLLAHGTGVEWRWPLYAAAGAGVVVGWLAAWLATRTRLRQSVLDMMRRVPARSRRRSSLALSLVVALVAASLVAIYLDPSSPIAWLAAPSIALIAGLIAARVLIVVTAHALRRRTETNRIASMLGRAWLARQPGRARVVAVLTTAVAVLVFGAIGWDVAAQARYNAAVDALGADRVYDVTTSSPDALISSVHAADPGDDAMAVALTSTYFGGQQVPLYAVDSRLIPKIGLWRGESADETRRLTAALRPSHLAPPLHPSGRVTVKAVASKVPDGTFVLEVLVQPAGQPPTPTILGFLHDGPGTYSGQITACTSECRFVGLVLARFASGQGGPQHFTVQIGEISGPGLALDDFSQSNYWLAAPPQPGVQMTLTPGKALGVDLDTGVLTDSAVMYGDTPASLPVVVSGGSKDDNPLAAEFAFPGLDANPESMTVVGRTPRVPAGGINAIFADLATADHLAERTGSLGANVALSYQVWADPKAPADLGQRLADHGVTVVSTDSVGQYVQRLARSGPTLSFWFYLISGVIALLLAIGVVLLGTYLGADSRIYAYAALKLTGVSPGTLRASVRKEYRSVLLTSLVVGAVAGAAGAVLMLPNIPLVTAGGSHGDVPYGADMVVLWSALGATIIAMGIIVGLAMGVLRRATPERLREGVA